MQMGGPRSPPKSLGIDRGFCIFGQPRRKLMAQVRGWMAETGSAN